MNNKEEPHFLGHRERLRNKFRERGRNALADYELTELILYRALPRGDVKPLAKKLIKHFGSFVKLIHAPRENLLSLPDVGDRVADELLLIRESINLALHQKIEKLPLLTAWQDLFHYCQQNIGYKEIECLHVFFLNAKHHLIKDEVLNEGTINRTQIYPREILRRAINYNACSVVLVHNHPSGNPAPSREDILMTKEVATVLKAADIKLHDHILVAKGAISSFQEMNLFEELNP